MRFSILSLAALLAIPPASAAQQPGYPQYCCTKAGRFGPFSNGAVAVGRRCSVADTTGTRRVGRACHGPRDPLTLGPMDTTGYANRCCTDVGVLGPLSGVTWQEGQRCTAQAEDGKTHAGVACYGVSGLLERARRDGRVLAVAHAGGCERSPSEVRTVPAVATRGSVAGGRRSDSQ